MEIRLRLNLGAINIRATKAQSIIILLVIYYQFYKIIFYVIAGRYITYHVSSSCQHFLCSILNLHLKATGFVKYLFYHRTTAISPPPRGISKKYTLITCLHQTTIANVFVHDEQLRNYEPQAHKNQFSVQIERRDQCFPSYRFCAAARKWQRQQCICKKYAASF